MLSAEPPASQHMTPGPWRAVQRCTTAVQFLFPPAWADQLLPPRRAPDEFGDESGWRATNGGGDASPDLLESGEVEWGAMPNLDLFFERVYRC